MGRLHLDFLHPQPPRLVWGIGLLALGVIAAGAVTVYDHHVSRQIETIQARIEDARRLARREQPVARVPVVDSKRLSEEAIQANRVITLLTLPWNELFADLEAAGSGDVTLLSVEPDAQGKRLRIGGEARRLDDLLRYVERLEARPTLASVFLVSHEMKRDATQHPVSFSLAAEWVSQ